LEGAISRPLVYSARSYLLSSSLLTLIPSLAIYQHIQLILLLIQRYLSTTMRGFNIFRSYQAISRSRELRERFQFHILTIGSLGGTYVFFEEYGSCLAKRCEAAKRSVLGLMGK